MNHCMLDLETLGNTPGCAILSIGAVMFGPEGVQDRDNAFYTVVAENSCQAAGLHEDPGTLQWWESQSAEARQIFTAIKADGAPNIGDALVRFYMWLGQQGPLGNVKMWGNGADFDNAILACAARTTGQSIPWKFWNNRCYRSLKNMARVGSLSPTLMRHGTYHNALDDAISQAGHAVAMANHLGIILA